MKKGDGDMYADQYRHISARLMRLDELNLSIQKVSGYTVEQLFQMFLSGYELKPPEYQSVENISKVVGAKVMNELSVFQRAMDNIVDVKLGQSIPPERWLEAAEDLEKVFQMVAQHLLVTNHEGMGQQDAEEFMSDAVLALVALRYVAANPEGCRFIPIPSKGGDK